MSQFWKGRRLEPGNHSIVVKAEHGPGKRSRGKGKRGIPLFQIRITRSTPLGGCSFGLVTGSWHAQLLHFALLRYQYHIHSETLQWLPEEICSEDDDAEADPPRAYCFIPSPQQAAESVVTLITPRDFHHAPTNVAQGGHVMRAGSSLADFLAYYLFHISHLSPSGEIRGLIDLFYVE